MIDSISNMNGIQLCYFPPSLPQKNTTVIPQQITSISNPYKLKMLANSATSSGLLSAKQTSLGFEREALEQEA